MSAEREARSAELAGSVLRASRFPIPTDAWVRALFAPALLFIFCGVDRNYQTDLWHHLARGRVIVEEGHILNEDRFTYTVAGEEFQDVNWLSQVVFYRVWQLGGLELLQAVNALLLAAMMGVVVALCRRSSGSMLVAGAVGVFTFLGLWQLILIRPKTFSLLLFVSLYAVLECAERRPWLLLLAPVYLATWVNLHGAFPIGLVLIGCYLLAAFTEEAWCGKWKVLRQRRVWLLAACLAGSVLATLLNPYGCRVYEYVLLTSGTAGKRGIDEWLPPGVSTLTGKVWIASLIGLAVLVVLARRLTVKQACLLAVFLIPACGSVRMVAWWLLVLAPVAASLLSRGGYDAAVSSERRADHTPSSPGNIGATLTCLVLIVGMVLSLPWFEQWSPLVRSTHRVEDDLEAVAVQLREMGPEGRIFTRFEWSEYLTWRLGPDFKVFMDGRIEIFPDRVWDDYAAVTGARNNWQQVLDEHAVEYLLIDTGPYHGRLRPLVENHPEVWERQGEQAGAVLVFRRLEHSKMKKK